MERDTVNAITSLSRTQDWKTFLGYIEAAVRELEVSLGYIDPNDALGIARTQGARTALGNILVLEDAANELNKSEETS